MQVFSSSGRFLTQVAEGILARPHRMAFDGTGALYIADTGNNVVRKFVMSGLEPTLTPTPTAALDEGQVNQQVVK